MLTKELGFTEEEISFRLTLNRISGDDLSAMSELGNVLGPHIAQIVDGFYAHLGQFPEALRKVTGAGTSIDNLKKTNPAYFAQIFRGTIDSEYVESRLRIGKVHAEIGITPDWFFGAMSTYYEMVTDLLSKKWMSGKKRTRLLQAFQKALLLDQQITMEAYIEFGFVGQLRRVALTTANAASQLTERHEQITANTDSFVRSVHEMATVCDQLAMASARQAETTQEVAGSMHSLSSVSERLNDAFERQTKAMTTAESAVSAVEEKIQLVATEADRWESIRERIIAIERVQRAVKDASTHVNEMETRSQAIGKIVHSIQEIADQTNLLALNAAIEAARAGEHGRGFAVVAEEVRKLAENASESTKEISTLIQAMQSGSQMASTSMDRMLHDIEDANAVTTESTQALERIAGHAEAIAHESDRLEHAMSFLARVATDNTTQIATLNQEINRVSCAMEGISAITEENSAASQEVSASTQEMSNQLVGLADSLHSVHDQISVLNGTVEKTKSIINNDNVSLAA